jgi:hypothetical protein
MNNELNCFFIKRYVWKKMYELRILIKWSIHEIINSIEKTDII